MEIIKVALASLHANRLRSTLTILGIVVGIFSIIAISTVISMLQTSIETGVSRLGQYTFQITKWPAVRTGGHSSWAKYRNRPDITLDDYYELNEKLIDARAVSAEQWQRGRMIKFENKETNPNVAVAGVTPESFSLNKWEVSKGRAFNYQDIYRYEKVIVLGNDVTKKLFDFIDPIGQEVKVDNYKLRIIGVLESRGDVFGQSIDNFALIPITTQQTMFGRHRSINISVQASGIEEYDDLVGKAEGLMRTIRKVPAGEENDFDIQTNESILAQINDITSGVRIGAFVVAAIALLAAGVGIMNIMLVSVTERTKEIGIRKAIGAKKRNILVQFLTEAVILCLLGGIVGIVSGVVAGNFAGSLLDAKTVLPVDWIMIGIFLCVVIGVSFGTYPAYKASNLDPIEALRYE
jgi:putative ABC transport system permease protein